MGKPTKRPRLASRAAAAAAKTTSTDKPSTSSDPPPQPIQRTKDEKRQARHDAFLKKIQEKKSTKRIRKRPKRKTNMNLLSLESSLDDIIAKDREAKLRKMEISVRPKGKEIKKEIQRFNAVMQHTEFKANPLKAIRQHIQNTWERKEGMTL